VDGIIKATGEEGAGIGTGWALRHGQSYVGSLTIKGGTITAKSFDQGAGIGTGPTGANGRSLVVNLTISGGRISATASRGAGIGTGPTLESPTCVSEITQLLITGGEITAESHFYGAGIGTGFSFPGYSVIDDLIITGGNIEAQSQLGAGIGAGDAADSDGAGTTTIPRIVIQGGIICASSAVSGAGIGAGFANGSMASADVTNFSLDALDESARIDAFAYSGAGIGAGHAILGGSASVASLSVSDWNIEAFTRLGAGVGAGVGGEGRGSSSTGRASVSLLQISCANVTATSLNFGAGIGGGSVSGLGNASIPFLTIRNSWISARSNEYSSIGTGHNNDDIAGALVFDIRLSDNLYLASLGSLTAIQALSIELQSSNLTVLSQGKIFDPSPIVNDTLNFTFLYEEPQESFIDSIPGVPGAQKFQIGAVDLPENVTWTIVISDSGQSYTKSFLFPYGAYQSFFVLLPTPNDYVIKAFTNSLGGLLVTDTNTSFSITDSPVFIPSVHYYAYTSMSPTPTATAPLTPTDSPLSPDPTLAPTVTPDASEQQSPSLTQIATPVTTETQAPSPTIAPPTPTASDKTMALGATIGIAVGTFVGGVIIGGVLVFCVKGNRPAWPEQAMGSLQPGLYSSQSYT
jgi:hypothetical protein